MAKSNKTALLRQIMNKFHFKEKKMFKKLAVSYLRKYMTKKNCNRLVIQEKNICYYNLFKKGTTYERI